jgi:hypothetical protein
MPAAAGANLLILFLKYSAHFPTIKWIPSHMDRFFPARANPEWLYPVGYC